MASSRKPAPATGGAKARGKAGKEPANEGSKRKRGRRKDDAGDFPGVTVAAHPRAGHSVRRAKGIGGLAGFGLAAALSAQAGVPIEMVGERAMAAGIGGYLLAWGCSVSVWRQLVMAEMKTASEEAHARHLAALEARQVETRA